MKARYWFITALICGALTIVSLRFNRERVIKLEQQVLARDVASQSLEPDLTNLAQFVFKHMNSSVGFVLDASYQRDLAAAETSGQQPPIKAHYTYSYSSPSWTPDLAGWLLVATGLLSLAALASYINGLFGPSGDST